MKLPPSYYGKKNLTQKQFEQINSGPSVFTKDELAISGLINPNKPIWILGPSAELSKYKDFITNDLKNENTMALGHVFYNLISNWDFTCNFVTWYDPHQLKGFIDNFDFIKSKLSQEKKLNLVTPSFNKNHDFFPSVSSFWNDKDYQKKYNELMVNVESNELFNLIYPKTMFLPWVDLGLNNHKPDQELSQKLYNDPDFRFNQYDRCVLPTLLQKNKSIDYTKALTDPKAGYLENALTSIILPIVNFLGFKKVFILGFDGNHGRMVGQNKINPLHSKFNGLNDWVKWKPFHNMEIVNLQKETPLVGKLPYTPIEDKKQRLRLKNRLIKTRKNIDEVCFIVQARLNSERVPQKMIKPFAGSTLLDICLHKLCNSSIIDKENLYLSCYDQEIISIGEHYGVNIFKRSEASANEEKDMKVIYEWHDKINSKFKKKYKYAILISACNPLLTIKTIDKFIFNFLNSKKEGSFSVFKKNNYFWDSNHSSITDWKGLTIMNTKIVDHVYEGAHCLYATRLDIIKKGYFMDTKSPAKPELFCLEELESFDIDHNWQFSTAEALFKIFSKEVPPKRELTIQKLKTENSGKLFNTKKVLILGPAISKKLTKKYLDHKRQAGYSIIAFSSSSLVFLKDIGFSPDFHVFIDPQSYSQALSEVGEDFLKDINFLGYDIIDYLSILSTNEKMFGDPKFGIKDFLTKGNFLSLYKSNPPSSAYKNCFTKNPSTIINYGDKKNKDKKCHFQSGLCRFTNGKKEIDKLTYFLLPIIFYWFQKIEYLDLIGFGFFESDRYSGGNKKSYPAYKSAYNKILPFYKEHQFTPNVNLSIESQSYFSGLSSAIPKLNQTKLTHETQYELNTTKFPEALKPNSASTSTNKFKSPKVLLIGSELDNKIHKNYLDFKRKEKYIIISFSSYSLIHLKNIGFIPDFHVFVSPECYCEAFNKVGADYLKEINFLGYELLDYQSVLDTNKKIYGDSSFGITSFLSNPSYVSIYKSKPPSEIYKKCFIKNPTFVLNNENAKIHDNISFKNNLYRFTNGRYAIEKLTYFLLPIILYWFKDLQQLDLIGFGLFDHPSHSSGNQKANKRYKEAYDKILYIYSSTNFSPKIEVSIESKSYFYDLKKLLLNNIK